MREKLTAADIQKIKEEIEHRKLVVRKEALEDVKIARAHGDLSENFEYKAAKQYKNQNESRIRYLERVLRTAIEIKDNSKEDEVGLNDTVELLVEEDIVIETYRIVTSIRGNSMHGLISIESPLGRALLCKKVGDRVHIKVSDSYGYDVILQSITKSSNEELDHIRKF